jgi:hypothetical protein
MLENIITFNTGYIDYSISTSHSKIKVWNIESETCLQTINFRHTNIVRGIFQIYQMK